MCLFFFCLDLHCVSGMHSHNFFCFFSTVPALYQAHLKNYLKTRSLLDSFPPSLFGRSLLQTSRKASLVSIYFLIYTYVLSETHLIPIYTCLLFHFIWAQMFMFIVIFLDCSGNMSRDLSTKLFAITIFNDFSRSLKFGKKGAFSELF